MIVWHQLRVMGRASNLTGAVAPGEIVALNGFGIGPPIFTPARVDAQGTYGTLLAGTRVLFNGIPAPLLYAWERQVSAIVPYGISGTTAGIQIELQGVMSEPIAVSIAPSAPGLFTLDSSGTGLAAALNEDGSLNTASKPAKPGSIVSFYATGEGQSSPFGLDGKLVTTPLPKPLLQVEVTLNGQPAEVLYAGGAPSLVAGLMQINARVPQYDPNVGLTISMPVSVTIGTASSQPGVFIFVSRK